MLMPRLMKAWFSEIKAANGHKIFRRRSHDGSERSYFRVPGFGEHTGPKSSLLKS